MSGEHIDHWRVGEDDAELHRADLGLVRLIAAGEGI